MQRDTDGTQLHVPDSPCSSRSMIPSCTEPEEVAAYCQVRNIWTILGGDLNQPGAKQATKVHSMTETCVVVHSDVSSPRALPQMPARPCQGHHEYSGGLQSCATNSALDCSRAVMVITLRRGANLSVKDAAPHQGNLKMLNHPRVCRSCGGSRVRCMAGPC